MPIFNVAAPDAQLRLVSQSKGFQQRAAYRDHLAQLNDGIRWEIEPEEDETLRKLKVNVRRAATAFCFKGGPYAASWTPGPVQRFACKVALLAY